MAKVIQKVKVEDNPSEQRPRYIQREMFLIDLNAKLDSGELGYEYIKFQFVPQELNMQINSSFVPIATVGRNNPFYHYTGSEDSLSFTLDWHASDQLRLKVIESCKWVESLSKSNGYAEEPHIVKLIWGDLFQDSTWIVTSASYKLTQFQALGMRPIQAYQEVELKRVISHNRLRNEILNPFS